MFASFIYLAALFIYLAHKKQYLLLLSLLLLYLLLLSGKKQIFASSPSSRLKTADAPAVLDVGPVVLVNVHARAIVVWTGVQLQRNRQSYIRSTNAGTPSAKYCIPVVQGGAICHYCIPVVRTTGNYCTENIILLSSSI
jgi:hypothetical protein